MSLFHYTSADAVLSILGKQELWLTDIRFLNDSEEARDGATYIRDAVMGLKRTSDSYLESAREHLIDFSVDDVFTELGDLQMFVASFSRIGDSLNQWRSYGLYCIEFYEELIRNVATFETCLYDQSAKVEYAKYLVTCAQTKIADTLSKNHGASGYLDARMQLWELGDAVSLFKHQSFKDENEARLITQARPSDEKIYYRTRGELVIPFQKLPFPLSHIKAVHIGPMKHQDLAAASITSLLHNIENRDSNEKYEGISRIKVVPSAIPYRAF